MKNLLKITAILLINIGYFSIINAQSDDIELKKFEALDTFNLKNYFLPELEVKSLGVDFNFQNDKYASNQIYKYENDTFSFNNYNLGLGFSSSMNGYYYLNTPKKQITGNNFISATIVYDDSDQDDLETHGINFRFSPKINFSRSIKHYKSNKTFIEFNPKISSGLDFQYQYQNYASSDENDYEKKYFGINVDFSPGFGIGKGRQENVTDAWQAIRILKDLEKLGLLEKIPNKEELIHLAQRISEIKYNRVLDWRIKRKQDLINLDEKLTELGLISEKDINYYTSLSDMWYYGVDVQRFTNSIYGFRITPQFKYTDDTLSAKYYDLLRFGLSAGLYYQKSIPVSMYLQIGYYAGLDYQYIYNSVTDPRLSGNYYYTHNLVPNFSIGFTKFLSSRAYISTSLGESMNIGLDLRYDDKLEKEKYQQYSFFTYFSSNFKFYIDRKTSINATYNLNLSNKIVQNDYGKLFYNGYSDKIYISFNHYFY